MNAYVNKAQEHSSAPAAVAGESSPAFRFVDNRPAAATQRKLQEMANRSTSQKTALRTGSATQPVAQRKILVGDDFHEPYDAELIEEQRGETKPYLDQWNAMNDIFKRPTKRATKDAKNAYLNGALRNDIEVILRKYNNIRSFDNGTDLTRQLVQDVKLKLLKLDSIIGITNQDGQFSQTEDDPDVARTGKSKPLCIYRTMKTEHWNKYLETNDPKDILWGHGGSLGQALHYFLKSKEAKLDDVLVEFEFSGAASSLVDYTRIAGGGEGGEPHSGKLTGKSEDNDVMELDQEIFSINLAKSKRLIADLKPKITLKDRAVKPT
jgi:hypothetical protein